MNETYRMSVISKTHSFGEMAVKKKNPVCICKVKQGNSVFFFLLQKSTFPKISFHKIGSEGLKGEEREGGERGTHTINTKSKIVQT